MEQILISLQPLGYLQHLELDRIYLHDNSGTPPYLPTDPAPS